MLLGVAGLAVVLAGGALVAHESTIYRPGPTARVDIALVGGTVLAGVDLAPIPDGVVLMRDGVIVDVGPSGAVEVPPEDLEELLDAGVHGLEHVDSRDLLDGWPEDLLAEVVEGDLPLTTTLAVSEAALPREDVDDAMAALQRRVQELHDAGGRIVVGSDAARPGVRFGAGVHRELELLVGSGMTPHEASSAATVEAAKVLRIDDLGAVAPGRAAEVIVVGATRPSTSVRYGTYR